MYLRATPPGMVYRRHGLHAQGAVAPVRGRPRFDPLRIFYVSLDMPAGTAIDATLKEVERLEGAIRPHLRAGELRGMAAYAGVKYTETEPLYGDAHGQVVVSLEARTGAMRGTDEIVETIRRDLGARTWGGEVSYTVISGGPPPQPAIKVRLKSDDYDRLRAATDVLKARIRELPAVRAVSDDDLPGRRELILTVDTEAIRAAGMSVLHAIVYAARRWVVPILITTCTTIGGLLALALGLGGKSLLWGPVAVAIVWGLAVSTLLTLFVVPLLYRFFMGRGGARGSA